MAKGDVTMVFDANTGAYVQAMLAAKSAAEAATQATERFAKVSAKAGDDIFSAFGKIATASTAMASGIKLSFEAVDSYIDKLEKRAAAARGQGQDLVSALAKFGHIGDFPVVNASLQNMSMNKAGGITFSLPELKRAYVGVSDALGEKSDPKQILESLSAYKLARGGLMDEAEATDVATQYARLAPTGNQGLAMEAHLSHFSEEDMRVLNRAKGNPEILRKIIAAKDVDEGPRILQTIDAVSGLAEEDPAHLFGDREEMLKQSLLLSAMKNSGKSSVETLFAHPELLGEEKLIRGMASVNRRAEELKAHPRPSLGEMVSAAQSPSLVAEVYERNTKTIAEDALLNKSEDPRATADVMERRVAEERLNPHMDWVPDWAIKLKSYVQQSLPGYDDAVARNQLLDAMERNTAATHANTSATNTPGGAGLQTSGQEDRKYGGASGSW